MPFAREIIKQILSKVPFQADNKEKNSYYTVIGGTLVRVSNHCTWLYVWDNFLEQNPKCKGMPIVSIVFEDNGTTFAEDCLVLKRNRRKPIKVMEYVYSLNGDANYLSKQDEKGIIDNIRRINGSYVDSTNKSVPYQRISKNPDNGDKEGTETIMDNNTDIKTENNMRRYRLTESRLRGMIREAVKGVLNESFVNSGDDKFDYLCNELFNYVEDWGISIQMEQNETFQEGRRLLHKALGTLAVGFREYYDPDED